MTQPRLFQVARGRLSEIPPNHIASVKWIDTISQQPTATVRLLPPAKLTPANAPERLIIVPSSRESLRVPAYGPYEVSGPYGWDGEGYTLQAAIGVDFAARFASDTGAALDSIMGQINSFSTALYEPFLGWTDSPADTDGPNVAKLGDNGFAELTISGLFNVGNLGDLETLLSSFGLLSYTLAEWDAAGPTATERLAIWPLHPLVRTVGRDFYFIEPRIDAVSSWASRLPVNFTNLALPNIGAIVDLSNVQYHPNVNTPDFFNVPHDSNTAKPSYRTRRINVGYRILGVNEAIAIFHTGTREPALYRNPQEVSITGSMKMAEELQRWNLQNTAADMTLKRFVADTWTDLAHQFFAPHQIVNMPGSIFPDGWPNEHRDFVVRAVTHEFTAEAGYSQEIAGTLWQGPFERLEAIDD